jgi:hypothetical protein
MSIMDAENLFSDKQNVFGNGTTVVSTDKIDLGQARDIGAGQPGYVEITVTTGFAGGTSANFQLVVADNPAITVNVTPIAQTGARPVAELIASRRYVLTIPEISVPPTGRRYLAVQTVNVGNNTAGAITAAYTRNPSTAHGKLYPAVQPFA